MRFPIKTELEAHLEFSKDPNDMSEVQTSKAQKKNSKDLNPKKAVPKNITFGAAQRLDEIKKEINDKPFGRSIRDSEILEYAIHQLKAEHFQSLRELTLSATDRLRIRHEEYQAINGELSLDEFVRRLVSVKI